MSIRRVQQPRPHIPTWETAQEEYFWIEVGAFYDRFGDAKVPVLASSDNIVQALVRDTQIRKYIDIMRPDVVQFVGYLQLVVEEVTQDVVDAIFAPTTEEEEEDEPSTE